MKHFHFIRICCLCSCLCVSLVAESRNGDKAEKKQTRYTSNPCSWYSIDGRGRTIDPQADIYPERSERRDKCVGIFYFIWHGCHGYDRPANHNEVRRPSSGDVRSPYDISEILTADSQNPQWGPPHAMHHWGEPYLGYYVSDDEWVIRKHAQLLSDAGVDVVVFDVTNSFTYIPVVKNILNVYTQMRKEGCATPQFAFILNSSAERTFRTLYSEIYGKRLYEELWFRWLGKPLVMVNPAAVPDAHKDEFTIRHSWYLWNDRKADAWYGDGEDKWAWAGLYPQQPGVHQGRNEYVSVAVATHPTSNVGRSFDVKTNSQPETYDSGKGIYFQSQFERAMELEPDFLFFTGWNEWTAQRQIASRDGEVSMPDRTVLKGGAYFVDQYNHEFSRDIEPMNGGFGDNYYYQLADYVRRFKGVERTPSVRKKYRIKIDGKLSDWSKVKEAYADDRGDTTHRRHFGWGRLGTLVNETGRNDILLSKVATDGTNLYFYVETAAPITPYTDKNWMRLFIQVRGKDFPSWEGFHFVLNRTGVKTDTTVLERCTGGWNWNKVQEVAYRIQGCGMEVAIPLRSLAIDDVTDFSVCFKWVDNAVSDGDIQTCMRDGDAAPNGRFRYVYSYRKK